MNKEFWRDKVVFVTGHTGFKGSWLSAWLSTLGAEVHGFSLAERVSKPCLFDLANVQSMVKKSYYRNILDAEYVRDAIMETDPDVVFHLAAQPIVKKGYEDPLYTFRTNIIGTANVLEGCINSKIGSIVIVTTDKVYDETNGPWGYRECDPLGFADPYSTSKACAELIAGCYSTYEMGDTPIATVRAGNVIGGGDFGYRIVPMIMESLSKKEPPMIWDPTAIRPWQHVLDCLNGYMLVAENTWGGSVGLNNWNFGPDEYEYLTCKQLADEVCVVWNIGIKPTLGKCPDTYPLNTTLKLNSAKARTYLEWKPKFNVWVSIAQTTRWYQEYYGKVDPKELMMRDIKEWENWI